MSQNFQIVTGTSGKEIAEKIAHDLQVPCNKIQICSFPDGEIGAQDIVVDTNKQVFFIASTQQPANNLIELYFLLKELQSREIDTIVPVISYLGFNRQDRRVLPGDGLFAEHTISLIASTGIKKVILVDVHTQDTIQHFNNQGVEVVHVSLLPQILPDAVSVWGDRLVIVGPDEGSKKMAMQCAEVIGAEYRILPKKRDRNGSVVRDDACADLNVRGKDVVLVDDMLDTAGTIVTAASILKENGARKIFVLVTHGLFSDPAIARLADSVIDSIGVSDTIPIQNEVLTKLADKIKVFSAASTVSEAIKRECNKKEAI